MSQSRLPRQGPRRARPTLILFYVTGGCRVVDSESLLAGVQIETIVVKVGNSEDPGAARRHRSDCLGSRSWGVESTLGLGGLHGRSWLSSDYTVTRYLDLDTAVDCSWCRATPRAASPLHRCEPASPTHSLGTRRNSTRTRRPVASGSIIASRSDSVHRQADPGRWELEA